MTTDAVIARLLVGLVAFGLGDAIESLIGKPFATYNTADSNRLSFTSHYTLLVHFSDVNLNRGMILGGDETVCGRAMPLTYLVSLRPIATIGSMPTYHLRGM